MASKALTVGSNVQDQLLCLVYDSHCKVSREFCFGTICCGDDQLKGRLLQDLPSVEIPHLLSWIYQGQVNKDMKKQLNQRF